MPDETRIHAPVENFACPLARSPLDLSHHLTPYNIAYAKPPHPWPVVARASRVFILIFITRQSPWARLLDLLVRVCHFDDRGALESFHKGRAAGLGCDCSNSKHLFSMQDSRPPRLVGDPHVHSVRKFYHLDHPLHRHSKELRKRRGIWNWFALAAVHFLSDSRLRQRAVSRAFGFVRDRSRSAAAARLALQTKAESSLRNWSP